MAVEGQSVPTIADDKQNSSPAEPWDDESPDEEIPSSEEDSADSEPDAEPECTNGSRQHGERARTRHYPNANMGRSTSGRECARACVCRRVRACASVREKWSLCVYPRH